MLTCSKCKEEKNEYIEKVEEKIREFLNKNYTKVASNL